MSQFNNIINGDEPVDMMGEEDFDNQNINDHDNQFNNGYQQQYNQQQFQQQPFDQQNLRQSQEYPYQRYSLTSLQQLMGGKNPKDFAKEFVYGDQRKIAKNLEKENSSTQQVFFNGNNQNRTSDLLQRFNSPKARNFGNEIQNTENQEPKSVYTQYSQTLKDSFKKEPANRFGKCPKTAEIMLSPTNINPEIRRLQTQGEVSVDKQKEHNYKLAREYEVFNHKKNILKEKYLNQEMAQCSFTPAINKKANDQYNKNRFYEHMDKKIIEKMNKNSIMKEDINKQVNQNLKTKPEISKKTQILAQKKLQKEGYSSQSVVDRLFSQGRKDNLSTSRINQSDFQFGQGKSGDDMEDMGIPKDPECTFKPYVSEVSTRLAENKQRYGTIDYKLFEDAKQRQQKKQQLDHSNGNKQNLRGSYVYSQQSIQQDSIKSPQQKSTYNQITQNKITLNANIERFKKEFETAYYAIVRNKDDNVVDENNFWSQKLTYYEVVEMMKVMYFLNPSPTEDWISSQSHSSAALAQKAWFQLFGKQNNYIVSRNLLVFLFAVQNVNVTKDQIQQIDDSLGNYQKPQENQQQEDNQQQFVLKHSPENQSEFQSHSERISHDNIDDEQQQISSQRQQQQLQQPEQNQIKQSNIKAKDLSEHLNPDERQPEHYNQYDEQSDIQQSDMDKQKNEEIFMEKLNKIQQLPKIVGYYDNLGNLYLTEQDTIDINRNYQSLYINRLSGYKGATHYRKISKQTQVKPEEPTGRPYISEISQQIAQNKRQNILQHLKKQGKHVKIDLNTILCFQKQMADDDKLILKHQILDEQMEGCTFKPETKSYSKVQKFHQKSGSLMNQSLMENAKKNYQTSVNPSGVQRTQELYKLAKPHNQKRDRLKEEIEYEKECDECTFQPDIQSNKKPTNPSQIMFMSQQHNSTQFQNQTYASPMKTQVSQGKAFATGSNINQTQNSSFYKDELKNIERVKKARVQKQVKDNVQKKGTTQNKQKLNEMQTNIYDTLNSSQRQPKQKRKAQTDMGNWSVNRSPNQSTIRKNNNMSNGSNFLNMNQNPNYNQYYGESIRQDTNGSADERNDYKGIQEKSPKTFGNNNYGSVPNNNMPGSHGSSNMGSQPPSVPQTQKTAEDDKVPLLFVDVNIEEGKTARIIVYEDDNSEVLATRFTQEHGLDPSMKSKLKDLLDQQINSLLTKIDEDEEALSDTSSDK